MKDFHGKGVVITGGALGMGKLWAERFGAKGARLMLWDINEPALAATKSDLTGRGYEVHTAVVDVASYEAVYRAAAEAKAALGGVEVLVNNAGIVFAADFLQTPEERISKTIDVDLKALFWTMKAFLPDMLEANRGHIVNISSASGFIGVPRMPAYCASKWGVIGLTESVRLEVKLMGKTGVHFTLVCPSYVDTGMFEGAKPPLLTRMLKPEEMVDSAFRAVEKDQYMVLEPWLVKLTPTLKGLLPTAAFDLVSGILGANKSMTEWKGR